MKVENLTTRFNYLEWDHPDRDDAVYFINLMPHDLTLILADEDRITIPAPEKYMGLAETRYDTPDIDFPLKEVVVKDPPRVPEREEGKYYIVGRPVCHRFPDRDDFLFPDDWERDDDDEIVGFHHFSRFRNLK